MLSGPIIQVERIAIKNTKEAKNILSMIGPSRIAVVFVKFSSPKSAAFRE